MKIKEIRAATVDLTPRPRTQPRVPRQPTEGFVSPMARYPEFKRADWSHPWHRTACLVTAEDGIEYGDLDKRYQQSTFGAHFVEVGVDAASKSIALLPRQK